MWIEITSHLFFLGNCLQLIYLGVNVIWYFPIAGFKSESRCFATNGFFSVIQHNTTLPSNINKTASASSFIPGSSSKAIALFVTENQAIRKTEWHRSSIKYVIFMVQCMCCSALSSVHSVLWLLKLKTLPRSVYQSSYRLETPLMFEACLLYSD